MAITPYVISASRVVRTSAVVAVLVLLLAMIAVRAFATEYGDSPVSVVDARTADDAVSLAVAAQESAGRRCSAQPVLTDVVLFQDLASDDVRVLTFSEAVTATAVRAGWIRGYCL